MKTRAIYSAVIAIGLLYGISASAQQTNHHNRYRQQPMAQHQINNKIGFGPRHNIYEGQRLPKQYNARQYQVRDWRSRHLTAPPRGYRWVRVNNDYFLAETATNLIFHIINQR